MHGRTSKQSFESLLCQFYTARGTLTADKECAQPSCNQSVVCHSLPPLHCCCGALSQHWDMHENPKKRQQGLVTTGRGSCTSYWLRKMCSCCTLMRRSVSLNSYGMFQPNGPKFRLSCTNAWKKQRPYSNVLNSAFKTNASPLRIHTWFKVFHFLTPCAAVLTLSHYRATNSFSSNTLVMSQGRLFLTYEGFKLSKESVLNILLNQCGCSKQFHF